MLNHLKTLANEGVLRPLDYQFARFINSLHNDHLLTLVSALVSHALGQGTVCLSLADQNYNALFEQSPAVSHRLQQQTGVPCQHWAAHLATLPPVGDGQRPTPLVLAQHRLYLYRYWAYETQVATYLRQTTSCSIDQPQARCLLNHLFCADDSAGLDWQKTAVALAATRTFAVISGGPGTGKTTTVTRLLALLIALGLANHTSPIIRLAAPTGKAAARLTEAINQAMQTLPCEAAVKAAIPQQAGTLHGLLGITPNQPDGKHPTTNPLPLDVLVVDEASMIDLPLMSRLLAALPPQARLVLLGDRDQLGSVAAGSLFSDLCAAAAGGYSPTQAATLAQLTGFDFAAHTQTEPAGTNVINDSVCLLQKSYRFADTSGIGQLAQAVNAGEQAAIKSLIAQTDHRDLTWHPMDDSGYQQLIQLCVAGYRDYLTRLQQLSLDTTNPAAQRAILTAFNRFQLLCALREGRLGVSGLNQAISHALAAAQLIKPVGHWYVGRPILITRNDHRLGLYNGDIGLTCRAANNQRRVLFSQPDGTLKHMPPQRLPAHETAFALTVHKSQGSEFAHTVLVLPEQAGSVVNRELLYTGITRAREKLSLFCDTRTLLLAAQMPTRRASGLAARL